MPAYNTKDYALYRGEELVMVGTLDEISQKQGIKKKLLQFYKTPSYRARITDESNRIVVVEVEDDDEDA